MKILLIQPPIRDFYQTRHRMYPLGLLYLASSLKRQGFSCRLLDACCVDRKKAIPLPKELQYLAKYYPPQDKSPFRLFGQFYHFGLKKEDEFIESIRGADLVGISCLFTPYQEESLWIARIAKKLGKLVVLGGNHATVTAEQLLENTFIDYIIGGEAEERLPDLCLAILGQKKLESIDGLGYRIKGQVRVSKVRSFLSDLDSLPFPDRSLLDPVHYHFEGRPYTMMLSSRGCSYRCRFCSGHAVMGQRVRFRSIDNIIAEMRLCRQQHKIEIFDFEDENFSIDLKRAKDLLGAIEEEFGQDENFGLLFENGLFPHTLDLEILGKIKRLGCGHLNLPLVSSSGSMRRKLKRPGSNRSFTQIVKGAGQDFFITGYLILGLPESNLKEMIQSIRFLSQQKVLIAPSFFYVTPGMDLYPKPDSFGLPLNNLYLPPGAFMPLRSSAFPIETTEFNRLDLVTLFRLVRILNFIKCLIDESGLRGRSELSAFLKSRIKSCLNPDWFTDEQEITLAQPASPQQLGLYLLSGIFTGKPPFGRIQKFGQCPDRIVYRLIEQEYSDRVWNEFLTLMNRSLIRGVKTTYFTLIWDF